MNYTQIIDLLGALWEWAEDYPLPFPVDSVAFRRWQRLSRGYIRRRRNAWRRQAWTPVIVERQQEAA